MREITRSEVQDPGAVPGASNSVTVGNHAGSATADAVSDVEIAKVLAPGGTPSTVGSGAPGTAGAPVGEGRDFLSGLEQPITPAPVVRWCTDCLAEGVRNAVDAGAPEGALCTFHEEWRKFQASEPGRAGYALQKCARKGCVFLRAEGSAFCTGHAACAASVTCDNLPAVDACACTDDGEFGKRTDGCPVHGAEQPNDRKRPLPEIIDAIHEEFYEAWWQGLAEHPDLDPRTVAVCKRARDDERLVRGRRP